MHKPSFNPHIQPVTPPPDFNLLNPRSVVDPENVKLLETELSINKLLPGLVAGEATALLLDVNNLLRRARDNGFHIDYLKLRELFSRRCNLRHSAAFSAVDRQDERAVSWAKSMRNKWGYTLFAKDLKKYINSEGKPTSKGNMDIEITLHAMKLSQGFSHVILGSCDGDFVPLVKELREGNLRKVSVLGVRNENWTGMSESLVSVADNFYDMTEFKEHIAFVQGGR